MSFHSPQTPQKFRELIYDTSDTQHDNVYTNITDMFNAISDMQEGDRYLTFLTSDTAPSGAWDWTGVIPRGNGQEYDSGGITLTVGTGTTLTWPKPNGEAGLRLYSTSSANIVTIAGKFTLYLKDVATMASTTAAFIKNTGGGQNVLSAANSARFLNGGYENYETTAGAFATTVIANYQLGIAFANDTLRSTNAQVFVQVLDAIVMDASIFPTSHTNLNIGFELLLNRTYAGNLNWTPTSKTATFTVTKSNSAYDVDASGGDVTANLPVAKGTGELFMFNPSNLGGNNLIIDANGSDTIDGSATLTISTDDDDVMLVDWAAGAWKRITP